MRMPRSGLLTCSRYLVRLPIHQGQWPFCTSLTAHSGGSVTDLHRLPLLARHNACHITRPSHQHKHFLLEKTLALSPPKQTATIRAASFRVGGRLVLWEPQKHEFHTLARWMRLNNNVLQTRSPTAKMRVRNSQNPRQTAGAEQPATKDQTSRRIRCCRLCAITRHSVPYVAVLKSLMCYLIPNQARLPFRQNPKTVHRRRWWSSRDSNPDNEVAADTRDA